MKTIRLWQHESTIIEIESNNTTNTTNSTWLPPLETEQVDNIQRILAGCIGFIFMTAAVWACVGVCLDRCHEGARSRKMMMVAIRINLSFTFVLFTLISVLAYIIAIAEFFPYRLIAPAILLILFILIAYMCRRYGINHYSQYKPDKKHKDMTVKFYADEVPTNFIVKDNNIEDNTNHKLENQNCSKYAFTQGNKKQGEIPMNLLGYVSPMKNNYESCTRENEKNEGLYRMCELEDFGNEKKDLSYVSEKVKL